MDTGKVIALTRRMIKKEFEEVGPYHYVGSVLTVDSLPTTGNKVGDVYNVGSTTNGGNYAWNGTAWDALGSLSNTTTTTAATLENFYYWSIEIHPVLSTATLEDIFNGNYSKPSNETFESSKNTVNFLTSTTNLAFLYQPDIESKAYIALSVGPISFNEEIENANYREFYGFIDLTSLSNNYSTSETVSLYEYNEESDSLILSSFTAQIELNKRKLWQNFQSVEARITLSIPETLHISSSITESFTGLLDFLNNSNIGIDPRQAIYTPGGVFKATSAIMSIFNSNNSLTIVDKTVNSIIQGNKQTFSLTPLLERVYSLNLTKSNNVFTFNLDQKHPQNIFISFDLYLTNPSSYSITFPNNVQWVDNNLPSFSTFNNMILNFSTVDYGTTWYGVVKFKN